MITRPAQNKGKVEGHSVEIDLILIFCFIFFVGCEGLIRNSMIKITGSLKEGEELNDEFFIITHQRRFEVSIT